MFNFFRRKPPAHPFVHYDGAQTYRVRVRTRRHGETVEFRFTRSAHIGIDDNGNYLFRKPVVSPEHFDRGELIIHFDARYNVTSTEAEGVDFIPISEWNPAP